MPEQMIPAGRPDSPARRRSAQPGKHPISLPLYLERDTEGKIGHPETELSVDRKLRHDIVACTDEDIGQETAVTGRLAVPPPTLLAHVRNLAAEGNARIGIEPLYELIMERSADTQQETVNLLPVRIVRIIVKTFAACGETHVAAHADGTVCVEQIVHDAVLSLYHYRRHDRITDIERRSRPYAGTEHDIAPAERILRLRFRRHARHEQGSEQDDSPFHTVHLHDSPFLPIPYLPCGKPPQSKYINFIRASLLYGRERKLPDGIQLYSPCIVKDWKCKTHSLSLSCYPMGRDILMKVFRFCLVMGI